MATISTTATAVRRKAAGSSSGSAALRLTTPTDAKSKTNATKKWPVFTMAQVATHKTEDDCWIVYHSEAFNVSKWLSHHPGGAETLIRFAGRDATDELRAFHPDWVLDTKLPTFKVGDVSDPPVPNKVQVAFRAYYKELDAKGYFKRDLGWYLFKLMTVFVWLVACLAILKQNKTDLLPVVAAAVSLGMFWQQLAFVGHDCGHMAMMCNRLHDWAVGLMIGNVFSGISIGWWKSTHNVHHAVPNALTHDPDIAHLPVFAVDKGFFHSIFHTFHNRVMPLDWAARNIFIPYQHLWYYPIMGLARFNLYIQGLIRLAKHKNPLYRTYEIITTAMFLAWVVALVAWIPSMRHRIVFVLVSHGVAGILHVQITLSHFSMPIQGTNDEDSDYGGDFYTRNIASSLDVDCPESMDWFHGGLQFQCIHHCFPRVGRRFYRRIQPDFINLCAKTGVEYRQMSFWDCNRDVMRVLHKTACEVSVHFLSHARTDCPTVFPVSLTHVPVLVVAQLKTWNPTIMDSLNAHG